MSDRLSLVSEVTPGERWLIRTNCHDCFIDVEGWATGPDHLLVLSLLSRHGGTWGATLGHRIKDAWRALRGRPEPYLDILTREEAEAVVEALMKATEAAFPPGPGGLAPGSTSASYSYPDDFREVQ